MSPHFQSYAANLNRVHLAEFLDNHAVSSRMAKVRPSLINNPVTGRAIVTLDRAADTACAARPF